MANSYIPASDAGFNSWLVNFDALLTADPTAYGLTAPDAAAVATVTAAWAAAYLAATDPSTRTPSAVAAKDSARSDAEAVVRPYAMQINLNGAVTDEQRVNLGLTVRKTVPTPVPAPTSAPALELVAATPGNHRLRYSDTGQGTGKAKPYGAIGVELQAYIGAAPTADPNDASYVGTVTKSPFDQPQSGANQGQMATYFARFITRSGPAGRAQTGPWSAPLSVIVT